MDELRARLVVSSGRLEGARLEVGRVWRDHVLLIKEAVLAGLSLSEVAGLVGVSKSRVWQLVRDV